MAQGLRDVQIVRSGTACNSACRFCCQSDLRPLEGERSSDEVFSEIRSASARAIVLGGGEVTLRPELVDWVKSAKESGDRTVVVQTNGRMLSYRKYARRLVNAGVDVFRVGVHGHIASLHDWLTRIDGSFEQAIIGMRNVQSLGALVYVDTVVTRSNFRHLPDIAKMLPAWGATGVRFTWARRCTTCPCCLRWANAEGSKIHHTSSLIPRLEMVAPYLETATGIARALNRRVSVNLPEEEPIMEAQHGLAAG